MKEKHFLTVNELQEYLGVSRNTAYDLVVQDDFPSIKIGAKHLVPIKLLEDWIIEKACKRNKTKEGEKSNG